MVLLHYELTYVFLNLIYFGITCRNERKYTSHPFVFDELLLHVFEAQLLILIILNNFCIEIHVELPTYLQKEYHQSLYYCASLINMI